VSICGLEQELEAELYVPRVAGGGDAAEGGGAQEIIRQVEVRVVEKIEGLGAKLKSDTFAERGVFHQWEVDGLITRTVENVSPGIAERTGSREGERRGVEPLRRRRMRKLGIADEVRTIVGAETEDRSASPAIIDLR